MNKDSLKYNRELAFDIFKNSLQEVHSISDESYIWKVSDLRKASEIFF